MSEVLNLTHQFVCGSFTYSAFGHKRQFGLYIGTLSRHLSLNYLRYLVQMFLNTSRTQFYISLKDLINLDHKNIF